MTICYSGRSAPSAQLIADVDDSIFTNRGNDGDVNWGRASANTSLNPDTSNCTNKRVMRELFKENEVPMPTLVSIQEAEGAIANGDTVVGRPDYHSRGRGFWKCSTPEQLAKALRGTRKKHPATHFMMFVQADREYRVHIFRGKSLRISEKAFYTDEDGKIDYTTIKPQNNIKHVRKAAKKAVKALGLDFGAVDVLATDDECWVLEVNSAPGLGGSMPQVYAKAITKWYERKQKRELSKES